MEEGEGRATLVSLLKLTTCVAAIALKQANAPIRCVRGFANSSLSCLPASIRVQLFAHPSAPPNLIQPAPATWTSSAGELGSGCVCSTSRRTSVIAHPPPHTGTERGQRGWCADQRLVGWRGRPLALLPEHVTRLTLGPGFVSFVYCSVLLPTVVGLFGVGCLLRALYIQARPSVTFKGISWIFRMKMVRWFLVRALCADVWFVCRR